MVGTCGGLIHRGAYIRGGLHSEIYGSSLVLSIYQISLQLKQSHVAGICSKLAQLMWHQAQHPSQLIQTTSSESPNGGSVISQIMHGSSSSSGVCVVRMGCSSACSVAFFRFLVSAAFRAPSTNCNLV